MDLQWPTERESLLAKVEPHRNRTVEERVRSVAGLFEFFRRLMEDADRRRKWERARRTLEEQARRSFDAMIRRGARA